jgi:hypothetical protein
VLREYIFYPFCVNYDLHLTQWLWYSCFAGAAK